MGGDTLLTEKCVRAAGVALAAVVLGLAALPGRAGAESAWVKDEVRINLRTGPGVQYRILGALSTGDSVEILSRAEGWTQVKTAQETGWIPEGFLQPEPPARLALERHAEETAELRERVERLEKVETELRGENEELAGRDEGQRSEIERLTRENLELKAGARWPEWVTGACIVIAGMALGAILQRSSGRRSKPRIKI